MFKLAARGKYEYADVFPFIYLKLMFDGADPIREIKHVIIDEMQDYTPIQYQIISHLYTCKKTILGDQNQSVNPLSSSTAESIREVLPQAECMYMNKSYRSTVEITELAQSVIRNPDLVPIQRHGEKPMIAGFRSADEELEFIRSTIEAFHESRHNSLAIICKTQERANLVHSRIGIAMSARLIDADSKVFSSGVLIATAYLAKGLEFDQVVVPFCTAKEYQSPIDRHMLYVACTRAMHHLVISHTAQLSPFLQAALDAGAAIAGRPASESVA